MTSYLCIALHGGGAIFKTGGAQQDIFAESRLEREHRFLHAPFPRAGVFLCLRLRFEKAQLARRGTAVVLAQNMAGVDGDAPDQQRGIDDAVKERRRGCDDVLRRRAVALQMV